MDWRERQEQWRRFHAWEEEQLRQNPPELAGAVRWFHEAAQVARSLDPDWGSMSRLLEHCSYWAETRARLSRLRPSG